jgi:radical SAM superfamily enzyme YgiQ (UPF0313 family)
LKKGKGRAAVRILLVEPQISPFDVPTGTFGLPPPYHLERIAGAVVDQHEVRILDMRIENDMAALRRALSEFQPDMVGCSCVAANSHLAKDVLAVAKQTDPGIHTVVGGHHPSLMPESMYAPCIDTVVIGEGELTLRELAGLRDANLKPDAVKGIAWRNPDGSYTVNPPRELMDLATLPPAARQLTRQYRDRQLYYRGTWRPTDSIISSRGCPFRCNFCGLWKIHRGKYRCRPPEQVVDELQLITDPFVNFVDDNTLDNVRNADSLASMIRERGIRKTYELYARADTVVSHPELVAKWRDLGMKLLLIGLESVDPAALEAMNKGVSMEVNRAAIRICHDHDVEIAAYFIVNPQFSRDDFRRLSAFVAESRLTHPIFTILTPFPGTELYAEVQNTMISKDLRLIDFYHTVMPTKLPLEEFYEEFLGLYRRAYPFKAFIKAAFHNTAMLSPKTLKINVRVKRKMAALYSHHRVAGLTG